MERIVSVEFMSQEGDFVDLQDYLLNSSISDEEILDSIAFAKAYKDDDKHIVFKKHMESKGMNISSYVEPEITSFSDSMTDDYEDYVALDKDELDSILEERTNSVSSLLNRAKNTLVEEINNIERSIAEIEESFQKIEKTIDGFSSNLFGEKGFIDEIEDLRNKKENISKQIESGQGDTESLINEKENIEKSLSNFRAELLGLLNIDIEKEIDVEALKVGAENKMESLKVELDKFKEINKNYKAMLENLFNSSSDLFQMDMKYYEYLSKEKIDLIKAYDLLEKNNIECELMVSTMGGSYFVNREELIEEIQKDEPLVSFSIQDKYHQAFDVEKVIDKYGTENQGITSLKNLNVSNEDDGNNFRQ